MTQSEIYYFAGKCLVLDKHPDFRKKIIEVCENNLIDWEQFVSICSDNYILPSIFLKFKAHNILEFLPSDLSEYLLEVYKLNNERNRAILEQIKSIVTILNTQDIFPVFLKGAGNLIDNLYSDIGERLMIDIDFLVPEEDFLKSAEILKNSGYLQYSDVEVMEVWKWRHYPPLYHPDFPASIEIHRIPTHRNRNWFNQETIHSGKTTSANLKGCFVLSDHHKIIHNFIHSQLSHKGLLYGNVPLRDIYDLHLLSQKVSLNEVLLKIKKRKKAITYFAFARSVFEFDKHFFPDQNLKYHILKKKHELVLNSPSLKKYYYGIISTFFIVKNKYIGKFFKAFYSKEIRLAIERKLKQ